jgi:tRNA A-37 threonylcarbamoyl transferase component Bud32
MSSTPIDAAFLSAFESGQRTLPVPTRLAIVVDGRSHDLDALAVLRLLPGKRVVMRGIFRERAVAIKLFVKSNSSARHIAREQAGYEQVRAVGLQCPRLLAHFVSRCGRFEGLIYEFLVDATDLAQCWPRFDPAQKRQWLRRLVDAMLQMHQRAGACQQDIHLGNFMFRDDQLYILDLGSIAIGSAPLPQPRCIDNLGQLIAQFDIGERSLLDDAVSHYFAQCGWAGNPALLQDLQRAIEKAWRYRLRDYLGKSQRDCTLTRFEQRFDRVLAVRREWEGEDLQRFVDDPDRFMANCELLKAGNTATVAKGLLNGRPVVIKRYNMKNWRHAIGRSLRRTRAEHSWRMAHLLEIMGFDSLRPVALLEHKRGPLRGRAWFISTWLDAPDLLSVGAQRKLSDAELLALNALLRQMVAARLSHGDFKANNLLLRDDHLAIIDLDSMRRHSSAEKFRRAFARDLKRLQRNWTDDSPVAEQIAATVAGISADLPADTRAQPQS